MTAVAAMTREDEHKLAHDRTGKNAFDAITEMVEDLRRAQEQDAEGGADETEAPRTRIEEDPLSVLVRDDWRLPGKHDSDGPVEYEILLSTGGPASRIVGKLNGSEPETAALEVQDWFVPWQEWRGEGWDENVLLDYARCFYFGD